MYDLIEKALTAKLTPIFENLARQQEEINELNRKLNNVLRIGTVSEVGEPATKIKVKHGENVTPFIRWFAQCAGETNEYRCPSIGEQCVLLNFGGGDNSSQTVALMGIFSNAFPPPEQTPNKHTRAYKDGTKISYDDDTHQLEVIMNSGSARFVVPDEVEFATKLVRIKGGELMVDKNITSAKDVIDKTSSMQDMRDTYNAHDHSKNVPPPILKMK